MKMKVIYCIFLIIFGMINLSVQKLKVVGDCGNYTHVVETLKRKCLQITCLNDGIKVQSCCPITKPCPDDGASKFLRGPKKEEYPNCCNHRQCVY